MKILHVISGLGNGGAEAVLYRLAATDHQCGNEHHVVSLTGRGVYAEPLEKFGVAVDSLDMPRGRVTLVGLIRLFKVIRRQQPDVVQTWMYHADLIGGLVARLAGVKAIAWGVRHGNLDPDKNKWTTLLIVRICANLSKWVPVKIISCSAAAIGVHQKIGYPLDKFVEIPNGYWLEKLVPDVALRLSLRKHFRIESGTFVLGMVARFDPLKDHKNLFAALREIKQSSSNFLCLLVGVGMDHENLILQEDLQSFGITEQVLLLGPRADISAVMNALDLHILSSLGEGFPNVLAEAMACATPCVSTDVGDAAMIVGEHGWIVPREDSAALARGILQAKTKFDTDPESWQALRRQCREHILANFEMKTMCSQYTSTWQMCLSLS